MSQIVLQPVNVFSASTDWTTHARAQEKTLYPTAYEMPLQVLKDFIS
jgi:hypothetical protein